MSWAFTEYPWQVILSPARGVTPDRGVRPDNGAGIWICDASEEEVAHLAVGLTPTRLSDSSVWFELPGPSFRADGPQDLTLRLPMQEATTILPYKDAQSTSYEEWPGKFHSMLTNNLQELADNLYKKRAELYDLFLEQPLTQQIKNFFSSQDEDFASRALICDLAEDLPGSIQELVERPRRLLQRKHAQVRLDRLQEIDLTSLIDYARRPGHTAAIKAGDRQQLMAVIREETADTLENRVVHDFCRRARTAAMAYVAEECARCKKCTGELLRNNDETVCSRRVRRVDAFARRCEQFLSSPTLTSVTPLAIPCRMPNYALQQNVRYVRVWVAYQKLLHQEDIRDQSWRWKRRTWTDHVRACMMEVMRALTLDEQPPAFHASNKPIRIRKEPLDGCWFKAEPFDGPLVFEKDGNFISLYLFNREDVGIAFRSLGLSPDLMNADLYWVVVSTEWEETRIIPVWTLVGDRRWQDPETAKKLRIECLDGIEQAGLEWYRQTKDAEGTESANIPKLLLIRAAESVNEVHRGRASLFELPPDKQQDIMQFFQRRMESVLKELMS
ncbi:MAG: DUF2357 domain-containing protein [Bacteroidales bacterium]|nr:DUF2357 domain-containing protein [Bacteroidales bacterium]